MAILVIGHGFNPEKMMVVKEDWTTYVKLTNTAELNLENGISSRILSAKLTFMLGLATNSHQVNGKRAYSQKEPQPYAWPLNRTEVAHTQDSNLKPLMLGMLLIDFLSCGRCQALHAVITRAEEEGSQEVDEEV
jgi:hypothetical protein